MLINEGVLYGCSSKIIYTYYQKSFAYNTAHKKESFISGLGLKVVRERGGRIAARISFDARHFCAIIHILSLHVF